MSVAENYKKVAQRVADACARAGRSRDEVLLLAVSKLHEPAELNEAIRAGATDLGENRVQELLAKKDEVLPVRWHLIGHLQTNKVKQIVPHVVMIHSVDSYKLAAEIDKRCAAIDKVMDILIEYNAGMEETKSGVAIDEVEGLIREIGEHLEHVRVRGIMCIPPIAEDPEDARPYFREAKALYDHLREAELPERVTIDTLSMGMSGDFEVAIEEGSTIVRVGSSIFGKRNYR